MSYTLEMERNKVTTLGNVGGLSGAKRAAKAMGACVVLRCNGCLQLFYREGEKIRQKTFPAGSFCFVDRHKSE